MSWVIYAWLIVAALLAIQILKFVDGDDPEIEKKMQEQDPDAYKELQVVRCGPRSIIIAGVCFGACLWPIILVQVIVDGMRWEKP